MEARTQFTFYESFFKAVSRIRKAADRAAAYDAICAYALYGTEPNMEQMPDTAAVAFEVAKPNLDVSRRKAKNGRLGGAAKQSEASAKQTQANDKQIEANPKQEKEQEKVKEKEKEQMLFINPPNPLAAVMSAYMGKVNPTPSQMSMEELKGYVESMGADVCLRAIDIALDAKKANWNYIRAILRDKKKQGVKCIADWDALDAKFEKQRGNGNGVTQHELPDL
jgi:DnaD/phage-associated family protein